MNLSGNIAQPVALAREWQAALAQSTRARLTPRLRASSARVSQVLRILDLAPDVLDAVEALGDPLDETSVQLIGEKRIPVPMAPGRTARFDYEYVRNGVCAMFMLNEPLPGWREVVVGDQRTALEFAHGVKHLWTCTTQMRSGLCW